MRAHVMRALLGFSLFALMAAGAAGVGARAETYPTRPVTFVVPFAPGGGTEFLARLLAQRLEQRLGKPFVIENRPGGGGVIGALSVARAAPDGYTILMAPSPVMAINVALHKKLPYDPAVDFVPVALVVATPYVLVVAPSLPVQSVADLIELAKAKPGQLSFASAGLGPPPPLFAHLVKSMTGGEVAPVTFPRLSARPDRCGSRTRSAHVLRYSAGARPDQRGQGACARRLYQGTRHRAARSCIGCGTGLGRFRRGVMADGGGAGGHAQGHRRTPACGD